jgi:hypothetical protein
MPINISDIYCMIQVIDLSKQFEYLDLWYESVDYICETAGDLKDNYSNLDPIEFECFTAVVEDNTILCFSALQLSQDNWGSQIGRCSTRMWVHPKYRLPGMKKFVGGDKFLNTTHCLPIQIEQAKSLGLDCIFVSREDNPMGFSEYVNLIKINTGTEFTMLSEKYNLFGVEQYVAISMLTTNGLTEWNKSMEKFKV